VNVLKALATVVGTALGFGIAGTALGAFLGTVAPSFFRLTFGGRGRGELDPVELGLAMGLINGLIWGLVIGVLLVAILAWRETRLARKDEAGKGT
jgi:hypothetical protein